LSSSISAAHTLTARQVYMFAIAAAVMVANIYYSQPLLAVIGDDLGVDVTHAGYLVTLTQLGYGLGVLLLVPLGDYMDRRKLASWMLAGCIAALALASVSPSFPAFAAIQLLVGITSSATMVVIPYVASHSPPDQRGKRVGQVITGLLLGILLARTVSGLVSDFVGWRWMYALAALAAFMLLLTLKRTMISEPSQQRLKYGTLMGSLMALLAEYPQLRHRSFYAMLGMGSFSALWTGLTLLLTAPPYSFTPSTIGLFGLIGAAGALSASFAGKLSDRGRTSLMTGMLAVLLIVAWALLFRGGGSIGYLIIGILVLDVAAMGLQVTHQSIIYKLAPEAQSRITSIFVTAGFIGMSAGSALGSWSFSQAGWTGVCAVGLAMNIVLLLHFLLTGRRGSHRATR
jgi:predicted MFS family arabinose efflux permease